MAEMTVHLDDLDGPACGAGVGFVSHSYDDITCDKCKIVAGELILRALEKRDET